MRDKIINMKADEHKTLGISKRYLLTSFLITVVLSILLLIPAMIVIVVFDAMLSGSNGTNLAGEQIATYGLYLVGTFFLFRAVNSLLYFFRSKLEDKEDGLEVTKGGFILTKVVVPTSVMAVSEITQNPFEAIFGLAKIEIRIPAMNEFKGVDYQEAVEFSKGFKGAKSRESSSSILLS